MGDRIFGFLTSEKMEPTRITTYVVGTTLLAVIIHVIMRISQLIRKRRRDMEALKEFPGPPAHWLYGNLKEIKKCADILNYCVVLGRDYPKAHQMQLGPFFIRCRLHHPDFIKQIVTTKGHFRMMRSDWLAFQAKMAVDYNTACVFHLGQRPQLRIFHPDTNKAIMTSEPKDPFTYRFLEPWIGKGLLISNGHQWARNRRLLTPAFNFDILKPYVTVFSKSTNTLVTKWQRMLSQKCEPLEMFEHVSLMTLDSLMKCIFGFQGDCQKEGYKHPYIQGVYELAELITERFRFFPYHNPMIYHLSWSGYKFRRACRLVHTYSQEVIQNKQKDKLAENGKKPDSRYLDFLDILIDARDEDGKGLTDPEIQQEVDTFMFEGHDTTASGISWCLYNLAAHPEYQTRCREEVNSVLGDRTDFSWDDMTKLPFLTMCVKESLRITPPVPNVSRQTTKEITFPDGRTIPDGIWVGISIYGCHHNPEVWEKPEVYDPYRFTSENSAKRSPHAFIPFSAGPRNCIGKHFAMHELKTAVGLLIRNFEFSVDEKRPPVKVPLLVLRSKGGLWLNVKPINQN